jgi:4-hydroxybenzoate polyprenyltransferase
MRFDPVAFLKLFRFPLVFTAVADSAAGYLIGSGTHGVEVGPLACLAGASAGLYFFGMALNDIADRNRDRELAPTRMLPSGRLSLTSAVIAAALMLGGSLAAILAAGDTPVLQRVATWGLVVVCILGYNLFLKVPPVMGFVRAFNLLLGVAAARRIEFDAAGQPYQYAILAFPALVYVTSLTFVSTLEDGAPSRVKLTAGAAFMAVGALLAALAGPAVDRFVYFSPFAVNQPWAFAFAVVLAGWVIVRARGARDKKGVMLLVRDGVGGIILLDAALLASFEGPAAGACVAAFVIPAVLSVAVFKRLA